jgi:PadR family transcriptional regulator PadR
MDMPMAPERRVALGEFELLVLLSVLRLGDGAYPVAVSDAIEQTGRRRTSRAAVQITLDRLEDKGFLTSRYGDPTPVRGGRAKRFFYPKPAAIQAVRQSLGSIERLADGLDAVLKTP